MRRVISLVLFIVLVALLWQLYQLYSEYRGLSNDYSVINEEWGILNEESLNLQDDLKYFEEPENLEKELRSRYNYKTLGEKLIIVVPPKEEE